ncbi:phage lytic cycle repressor MrpR family protein [Bacillus sp. UMB0728]|uniref:phage lytic cycle repressor MrpR family protein n=1 Tax=Bacillus sp. UMB0728 TaxID=2066052 RepID=UPI000C7937C7|nr:hypothetical protein [Bacillus sp. UMB0728]PLR72223.1 hypothetical protein CYJ37_11755 [Bacillus sp. UMB0728]
MAIKLYNEEIKERFLSTYENEGSQYTLSHILSKAIYEESRLEKDLYDFNLSEIGEVIANAKPHSKSVAKSYGRFLTQYISWAIEEGLRKSNINPLKGINDSWFDDLVDNTKKIHYSEDEFYTLLEQLPNAQDQGFLFLLFHGIMGKSFSQIQPLTYNDVDWNNNEIYIKERDEKIKVSDRGMRYIENAYKAASYLNYDPETGGYKERPLLESDYIIKQASSPRSKEGSPVTVTTLYNRLNNIRTEFDLEHLTPIALRQSGMISLAAKILQEKIANGEEPKLSREDIKVIGDKYQASKIEVGEYSYYNRSLMKPFINAEKLKELYDIDFIEFGSDND